MYNNASDSSRGFHKQKQPEYKCLISSQELDNIFQHCGDFEMREILFGLEGKICLHVCWLDGVVSGTAVTEEIIRPLTQLLRSRNAASEQQCLDLMLLGAVYSYSAKQRETMDQVVDDLTHGHCAVILDGINRAVCFEVRTSNTRGISEPTLEKSLKGAKDAFVETLRINTSLVRRRICSPKLKVIENNVGRKSHTKVAILFVDGVADPATVEELARRLDGLDVDALLATGTLEEYIVDAPLSPLPQLLHTERPDRFAMQLMAGRVGLLVDGLPIGLLLPASLADFMRVTGDSSNHYMVATFLTLLRYLSFFLAIFLPAMYVAVAMYHQEMIPTRLLLSIIEAKRDVPFSTALEIIGMLLAFELLQEAGLRLPNPMGDTISIIGALIVGQSAVEARVVSPIAIIVVATAGIAGYTLPSQDLGAVVRLLRLVLVIAATAAGLFGVGLVLCLFLLHLASLDSFGMNYTAPLTDGRPFPLLRLLIRVPKPMNKYRDPNLNTPDKRRQQ
ncbi:MAG: spore germination protein [Candidatus Limivicinus sp.]